MKLQVLKITHRNEREIPPTPLDANRSKERMEPSGSTSFDMMATEDGSVPSPRPRSTYREFATRLTAQFSPEKTKSAKPRIPAKLLSPLNILSVGSSLLTLGLLVLAIIEKDGVACLALGTISLASSIVGFASWWSPVLKTRDFRSRVPPGDTIIRTREGAFLLVICNEEVARELYTTPEEFKYYVTPGPYRVLVGFGTLLLMVSVVLLGNCNFKMQAAIGASYMALNGMYWAASLVPGELFWDLSLYDCKDITPLDAKEAHQMQDGSLDGIPSYTRTLWYALRETKKTGWLKKGGIIPDTPLWDQWLKLAELNATNGNRKWDAVAKREQIVGQVDSAPQAKEAVKGVDTAAQHVPVFEIPMDATK
jgi:hypothetical protein